MSQSFFKTKCPKCGHVENGSCGGWGLIGQETTTCRHKPKGKKVCGHVFETHPHSFGWQTLGANEADTPEAVQPAKPRATKPKKPRQPAKKGSVMTADEKTHHRLSLILADPDREILIRNKRTGKVWPFEASRR